MVFFVHKTCFRKKLGSEPHKHIVFQGKTYGASKPISTSQPLKQMIDSLKGWRLKLQSLSQQVSH